MHEHEREGILAYVRRVISSSVHGGVLFFGDQIRIMIREARLFLGTLLVLVGLMNYEVGKYCDGNTAEYLSCTRPAVFYYFDTLDIVLVIVGFFFLLAWYVRRLSEYHH